MLQAVILSSRPILRACAKLKEAIEEPKACAARWPGPSMRTSCFCCWTARRRTRPSPVCRTPLIAGALKVWSKADLPWPAPREGLKISVRTGEGFEALLAALMDHVRAHVGESALVTRARHRDALGDAAEALARAGEGQSPELVAEDLRLALRAIGRITGRVDVEDTCSM